MIMFIPAIVAEITLSSRISLLLIKTIKSTSLFPQVTTFMATGGAIRDIEKHLRIYNGRFTKKNNTDSNI